MQCPIEWLPDSGAAEQLILLLHDAGDSGAAMAPLAQALQAEFPQAAVLAPDAPLVLDGKADGHADGHADGAADGAPGAVCRQWFSSVSNNPGDNPGANPAAAVTPAVSALLAWVRATQDRLRLPPVTTALGGFGQGATLALEAAVADDGIAGRVLAFGGRFASLPQAAPRHTTVHLLHGGADAVVPVRHAHQALEVLGTLRGDATLDIAEGVGHAMHPALLQRALFRLRNHIPARTWAAALGSVPAMPPSSKPND